MDPQSQEKRSTWAKIEIMGHETYYGWIEQSPWVPSGIRAHILPAGDEEGKKPSLVKDWGENAIFGITPLSEEDARELARQDRYEADILGYSEQGELISGRIETDEAVSIAREAGFNVTKADVVDTLADEVVEKMTSLNALAENYDLGDDVERVLRTRVDNARRALSQYAPKKLHNVRYGDGEPEDDLPW